MHLMRTILEETFDLTEVNTCRTLWQEVTLAVGSGPILTMYAVYIKDPWTFLFSRYLDREIPTYHLYPKLFTSFM